MGHPTMQENDTAKLTPTFTGYQSSLICAGVIAEQSFL